MERTGANMDHWELAVICTVIGYLCGCFLTAELAARLAEGKSASEIGSGNPGMANIMANLGKKAGFFVLAGDVGKTLIAFGVSWLLAGGLLGRETFLWAGLGVVLGHNFPFWKKFRGGKGVAVTCTWLIFFMPVWGTVSCIAGGAVVLATGYLPLGAVLIPLLGTCFAFFSQGIMAAIFFLLSFLLMLSRHYRGLLRIVRGTEERKFRR